MIAYRSQERVLQTADVISEIAALTREGARARLEDLVIRFGEFEAGVADASATTG